MPFKDSNKTYSYQVFTLIISHIIFMFAVKKNMTSSMTTFFISFSQALKNKSVSSPQLRVSSKKTIRLNNDFR